MKFIPGLHPRSVSEKRNRPLATAPTSYVVPAHIDRRPEMLASSNQGNTSQCVAYAIAGWVEYYRWKKQGIAQQIAPAPIYERAKSMDGMPGVEGTTLEAGLQAAQDLGLMSPIEAGSLREVNSPAEVQQSLHRYGVVLAAFNVTDGWMKSDSGGWIRDGEESLGGHAVVLCGYSLIETPPWFALQNSWGEGVGWRGFNRLTLDMFNKQFDYGLVWDWDA